MADKRAEDQNRTNDATASDMEPKERHASATWESPSDAPPGGSVSASHTARPRDEEAVEGEEDIVAGFTGTSSSGSVGGRALYGIAPEGELRTEPGEDEEDA